MEIQTDNNEEMLMLASQQISASINSLAVRVDGHEGEEGKGGTVSGLSTTWRGHFCPGGAGQ